MNTQIVPITVPLKLIWESPRNMRRIVSPISLEELAASIREMGILVPLIVRPRNGSEGYEVVAGARRRKAAELVGLKELPVIVREMSDVEADRVGLVENLQREDIHPLDEARGFAILLEEMADFAAVQAAVAKPERHIRRRLQLNNLIEPVADLYRTGTLNLRQAELLARMPGSDQADLYKHYTEETAPAAWPSAESLRTVIQRQYMLRLKNAPFKRTDAELVPAAGACVGCPKCTGNSPTLFDDLSEEDLCTDAACFETKLQAFLARKRAALTKKHKESPVDICDQYRPAGDGPLSRHQYQVLEKDETCANMEQGLVVEGAAIGSVLRICRAADCPTHGRGNASAAKETVARNREKQEAAKARDTVRYERQRRELLLQEIVQRVPAKLGREDLELLALRFEHRLNHDQGRALFKLRNWTPVKSQWGGESFRIPASFLKDFTDAQLLAFLVQIALVDLTEIQQYMKPSDKDALFTTALRYQVDVKAINQRVRQELDARQLRGKARTEALAALGLASPAPETPAPKSRRAPAKRSRKSGKK